MRERRVRHSVDAEELGGDALAEAARMLRVDEQVAFGVGVGVDEPWGDDQTARVDDAAGRCLGEIAEGGDPLTRDADVGGVPGRPGSVDDCPAGDEHVEHGGLLRLSYQCCVNRPLWRG